MTIEVGYELVPWETAADWLATLAQGEEYGFRQRQRVDNRVIAHAEGYLNGHFRSEASGTIDFHRLGFLVNGQHRLSAQVKTKTTLRWLIRRGLEDEDVRVLDLGAKRSAPDVLRMSGEINYTRLAATVKRLYVLAGGASTELMPAPLVLDILNRHPKIRESVNLAKIVPARIAPDTNFAAIHYLGAYVQKKEKLAEDYLNLIAKGFLSDGSFPSSPNNVGLKLREAMSVQRAELQKKHARWQYDVPLRYALWGWQTFELNGTPKRVILWEELPKLDYWGLADCLGETKKVRKKVAAKKS
jgi:hypothetical protein